MTIIKKVQLDPYAYNEFVFQFLTQHDNDYLIELHQLFMQKVIRPQMRPEGFKAIERHHEAGHTLVGITATSDFLPHPFFVNSELLKLLPPMLKSLMVNILVKSSIQRAISKASWCVWNNGWKVAM